MAQSQQTLDQNGNVMAGGFSTNMTPTQYSSRYGTTIPAPTISPTTDYYSLTSPTKIQGSLANPAPVAPPSLNSTNVALGNAESVLRQSQLDTANSQEAQTQDYLNNYIKNNLGLSGGMSLEGQKAQTQEELSQGQGLNDKLSRVSTISNQIKGLDFTNEADKQRILASPIGGLTSADYSGRQEEIDRKTHIQRLDLTAQLFAAQGDVTNANAVIERAIQYKYADREAKLKNAISYFDMNEKTLGRKATEQKEIAQAKLKDLEVKRKNDEDISKMITDAIPNAPPDVIARANAIKDKGGSALQVAQSLGEYGGDYLVREELKAKIRKMDAESAKTRRESIGGGGNGAISTGSTSISSTAKDWVSQFNSGLMSIEDIYTKIGSSKESIPLKNEVARLIAQQGGKRVYGTDDATIQAINSQIKNVDDLLKGDVGSVVGLVQGGLGVLPDTLNIYKQDALGVAKNLVSNQTLQALADAKSKGITFGALSEAELNAVAESASRISAKLKKDKDGNIVGFSGSEGQLRTDLKNIKDGLQKSLGTKTGNKQEDKTADDIMNANTSVRQNISKSGYNIFQE